ncbi:hypothetical protein ACH4TY_29815 [Streptomyces anulatus]
MGHSVRTLLAGEESAPLRAVHVLLIAAAVTLVLLAAQLRGGNP